MTDAEILDVIGRLTFVFAKTMPEIPHEYTVRKPETEADYGRLWDAIKERGVSGKFQGLDGKVRRYKYLYPGDGYRYWVMGPKYAFIINRARVEEEGGSSRE